MTTSKIPPRPWTPRCSERARELVSDLRHEADPESGLGAMCSAAADLLERALEGFEYRVNAEAQVVEALEEIRAGFSSDRRAHQLAASALALLRGDRTCEGGEVMRWTEQRIHTDGWNSDDGIHNGSEEYSDDYEGVGHVYAEEDATFIAAARTAVPVLLARVAALETALRLIAAVPAFPSKDIADRALGTEPEWEPKAKQEWDAKRAALKGATE